MSASALRREMKQRASLCSRLFKKWEPELARLSELSWKTTCLPLDAGTKLIRHQDGTIECQALKRKKAGEYENSYDVRLTLPKNSWERDPGLDAYAKRLELAWITERFLCFAVKIADEHHIWRFEKYLEDVDKFIRLEAPLHTEWQERRMKELASRK